ncbi:MAG: LUD domain-containing protein [Cytophagales bacterium]|nr:LUD domain-containing protein [Bernardetiaceae bacterium]MDW8209816.1 LUD domain-containing protein [Cytophagales bacterium]
MSNQNTSRQSILSAIKRNKPEPTPLPSIPKFEVPTDRVALTKMFMEVLQRVNATAQIVPAQLVEKIIQTHYPNAKICSRCSYVQGNVSIEHIQHPTELADVEVAVLEGVLGVAENGAIWLGEEQIAVRALPFITQHLVILLPIEKIVANMHLAYEYLGTVHSGFGVFISGPSRTADIEQSLVVGAHGARSLLVLILSD